MIVAGQQRLWLSRDPDAVQERESRLKPQQDTGTGLNAVDVTKVNVTHSSLKPQEPRLLGGQGDVRPDSREEQSVIRRNRRRGQVAVDTPYSALDEGAEDVAVEAKHTRGKPRKRRSEREQPQGLWVRLEFLTEYEGASQEGQLKSSEVDQGPAGLRPGRNGLDNLLLQQETQQAGK